MAAKSIEGLVGETGCFYEALFTGFGSIRGESVDENGVATSGKEQRATMERDLNCRTYRNVVVQSLNRANGGVRMLRYSKNPGITGPEGFPENMIKQHSLEVCH